MTARIYASTSHTRSATVGNLSGINSIRTSVGGRSSIGSTNSVTDSLGAMSASSNSSDNQSLQRLAATAWNYQAAAREVGGHEYLNDIYFEEDEKVYEDLCYVTFSSKATEVRTATHILHIYLLLFVLPLQQNIIIIVHVYIVYTACMSACVRLFTYKPYTYL